ncbi:dTDP-4-dehydrorhamnose reductase [Thermotalea metallivorans]|uniref:dTDP-4-dehydrorhamnose reductase n=1 Tax=Thermotalea metallivorans TaxID=520762 RepID=A0A140L6V4_9FIRM|nr:dTDP-4-dehydrorhamnose reductase [Thermotalea metallivorans]KXG76279.1 dTDP-4-dehydrorhamnose reductase [Thermotalea metallivorans]
MKILVTGASGMLGHDLVKVLCKEHEVVKASSYDFDITDIDKTVLWVKNLKPQIVIHAAAYTEVDGCESNVDIAYKVNALGARNVAVACNEIGASMVYISSDYVFDGLKGQAYKEFDNTNPLSIYGKSKLAGENYVREVLDRFYIVRTSWLYGLNGKNFVTTMINLSKTKRELNVVNDQIGSPTYTFDLAKAIEKLIEKQTYGVFHITNSDYCSWYDYAKEIFDITHINIKVNPITTEELNRPAPRPKYSVLENYCWKLEGYTPLRSYKEALREYICLL